MTVHDFHKPVVALFTLLLVPLFTVILGRASEPVFFDPLPITGLTALILALDGIILVASIRGFGINHILEAPVEPHSCEDPGWLYLQYDTFLSRRSPWVFVLAGVLLGEFVNVRVGTFKGL